MTVMDRYVIILNPGKCGSSWLAHALSIGPYLYFPREFDFIYFLEYPLERQWNKETATNPAYLDIKTRLDLTPEERLLRLYEAELQAHPPGLRLIDKAPSNLYAGFEKYRHLYRPCKIVTLYRDPRDIYISNEHFQRRTLGRLPERDDLGSLDYLRESAIFHGSFKRSAQLLALETQLRGEGYEVHRVRYEDMKRDFRSTLTGVLDFLEVRPSLSETVYSYYLKESVSFRRHLDLAKDFRPLFRKGVVGDWKSHISSRESRQYIVQEYGDLLTSLGYDLEVA